MENNNPFENLSKLLQPFQNSEKPEDRLVYLKSIKTLIEMGERLYKLREDEELRQNIEGLRKIVGEYKIYKINNN